MVKYAKPYLKEEDFLEKMPYCQLINRIDLIQSRLIQIGEDGCKDIEKFSLLWRALPKCVKKYFLESPETCDLNVILPLLEHSVLNIYEVNIVLKKSIENKRTQTTAILLEHVRGFNPTEKEEYDLLGMVSAGLEKPSLTHLSWEWEFNILNNGDIQLLSYHGVEEESLYVHGETSEGSKIISLGVTPDIEIADDFGVPLTSSIAKSNNYYTQKNMAVTTIPRHIKHITIDSIDNVFMVFATIDTLNLYRVRQACCHSLSRHRGFENITLTRLDKDSFVGQLRFISPKGSFCKRF